MENINYTKFSEEKKEEAAVNTATEEKEVMAPPPVDEPASKNVEDANEPKEVMGIVVNCDRLRVRGKASKNAAVLKIIDKNSKVKIIDSESSDEFYKVQIAGITGFCMKEFITLE